MAKTFFFLGGEWHMAKTWLRNLFGNGTRGRKAARSRLRLELEPLELRMVPAAMYDVQWLGTLSPSDTFSAAQGINDAGQIVGNSQVTDANGIPTSERAFLYTPGVGMVDIGTAGATGAFAWDINAGGRITGMIHQGGSLATGGYWEWAALWDGTSGHTIPGYASPGMMSVAYGVNDSGVVVGNADVMSPYYTGNSEAYRYDGTTLTFLGTLGGKWSYGMDINNNGYVAGFADTGANPSTQPGVYMSRYHAVIWAPNGAVTDLGTFGTDSYAYKINATNQAVGSTLGNDGLYHAFLYDGTRLIDIGFAGVHGEALSINNQGQVVGDTVNWGSSTAFLYEAGATYDLNYLLNANTVTTGDFLMSAHDINNLGQVVGYGLHNGHYEAFVLTPNGVAVNPPTGPASPPGGPATPPAPTNAAPTADAGGPYAITDGNSLTIDATLSSDPDGDPLTYSWDINGDGVYGDATGAKPTLTAADLHTLGVVGGASYSVSVQVDDGQGNTAFASTSLTVAVPTGPTATVSGPTDGFQGVTGQVRTLDISADGTLAANGFEYRIAWGDGSYDDFNGAAATQASHVYNAGGSYTVSVTATDSDGVHSDAATVGLTIQRAEQQGGVLAVGGTAQDDTITLSAGSTYGTVVTPFGTFTTSAVMVFGGQGSDRVVVQGTAGNDTIGINPDAVALNGFYVQGTSVEGWTADALAGNDTFYVNGPGLPINLKGGDGDDMFKVTAVGAVNGRVDGGTGSDILDYSLFHNIVTVNLQDRTATATSGFNNVEGFVGSNTLLDTIIGANTTNTWQVYGNNNAGKIGSIQFSSFENWVGGAGDDTFKMVSARYVSGVIDGGAGLNTLDYSGYTSAVGVDLAAGTATNVRGGVANIGVVIGGSGADLLHGGAGDSILIGGAGDDVLTGGSGNNVLVGGAGNDTLTGGLGRNILIGGLGADILKGDAGEDILIGGTTSYDSNVAALNALMAEWKRTDLTYQQRIDHLTGATSGGLNGSVVLKSTTVKDDATADQLSGLDGLDWFWALAAEAKDLQSGERLN